ncbi:MAG: DegQ family serine endoprotease [Magnetospiraceae bacterium]
MPGFPKWLVLLACVMIALSVGSRPGWAEKAVPETEAQIQLSYAPLVKKVAPAVVNIFTKRVVKNQIASPLLNDPFFRHFFEQRLRRLPREQVQSSLGSGVIVTADGLVVTNNHVIAGADDVTVVLSDRREFAAEIIGTDEGTDLAVLRIQDGDDTFPFLTFSDSDDLEVGDLVLAIGNPFGVGQTVTSGIVSALARTQVDISDYSFFIQTDAAINPGNSGGALVDMSGNLVGINTAIYSRTGGSVGIGFAIPSNMVHAVLASIGGGGQAVRPWLGAAGQSVTTEIAGSLGLDRPVGVLVNRLHAKSPAGKAGLRVGDVIVKVDGRLVDDPQSLRYRIATQELGAKAVLTVMRRGKEISLTMTLSPPPEDPPRQTRVLGGQHPLAGATVENLSPAVAEELGLPVDATGVVIVDTASRSNARRLRFRRGDIIHKVNGQQVSSVPRLEASLQKDVPGWLVEVQRGENIVRRRFRR